jgi:hypothetical protein
LVNLDEIIPLDVLAPTLQPLCACKFFFDDEASYSGLASLEALNTIWLDSIDLSDAFTRRPFFFSHQGKAHRRHNIGPNLELKEPGDDFQKKGKLYPPQTRFLGLA